MATVFYFGAFDIAELPGAVVDLESDPEPLILYPNGMRQAFPPLSAEDWDRITKELSENRSERQKFEDEYLCQRQWFDIPPEWVNKNDQLDHRHQETPRRGRPRHAPGD
jgi:hypothetical protein